MRRDTSERPNAGIWALSLVLACSQPSSKPAPKTQRVAAPAPSTQKVLISERDLPAMDANRFFYVFPIEMSHAVEALVKQNGQALGPAALKNWCIRLRLRPMTASDRKELAVRVGVKDRFRDYFQLAWAAQPIRGEPVPGDKSSSFVMDFDDPRFSAVWSAVTAKLGAHPSADELEAFVADYINVKTTTRMFDTAAEVAKSRRGDCSEHATLLTALLRRSGKAARLATGLIVIVDGKQLGAFGHAWTEWYDQGGWRIADAAMHPVPGQPALNIRAKRYIPVVRMVDEGPGFAAAMDNVRSIEAVSGIEVDECAGRVH